MFAAGLLAVPLLALLGLLVAHVTVPADRLWPIHAAALVAIATAYALCVAHIVTGLGSLL